MRYESHELRILRAHHDGQPIDYRIRGCDWQPVLPGHTWNHVKYQYQIGKTMAETQDEYVLRIVTAHKDGKTVQYRRNIGEPWHDTDKNPGWNFIDFTYQVKTEPREYWVNVYPDRVAVHETEALADYCSDAARLECIRVREVQ